MRKAAIAAFLVLGLTASGAADASHPAAAEDRGIDWKVQTYEKFSTETELNAVKPSSSAFTVNTSDGKSYITTPGSASASESGYMVLAGADWDGNLEKIDGVRIEAGFPNALADQSIVIRPETMEDGTNYQASPVYLTGGENTVWFSDLEVTSNDTAVDNINDIFTQITKTQGMGATVSPRIYSVEFLMREQPDVFTASNITVEDEKRLDAFSADSIENMSIEAGTINGSLDATLIGYNETSKSSNQTFTVDPGSNTFQPDSFSENTSTFVLELDAVNGTTEANSVNIQGLPSQDSPEAGVIPDNGITGGFFKGNPLSGVFSFFGNLFNGFTSWIGGIF